MVPTRTSSRDPHTADGTAGSQELHVSRSQLGALVAFLAVVVVVIAILVRMT